MNAHLSCQGILGWIFGHKFRPRFTRVETQRQLSADNLQGEAAVLAALAPLTTLTYICDVCERCGTITKESL